MQAAVLVVCHITASGKGWAMRWAMALSFSALLLAAGQLAAADKEGDAKFDPAKLVGTYQYVSGVKDGEKLGADHFKSQKVVITKESFTLEGDQKFVMKYEIDAKKKPATIKFTMTESPFGAGAMAEGVIELNGDELKLCYAPMGGDPPKAFESKAGSKFHCFVLKKNQ
jgi:uncharacterized protein (TIGR03067 family)